jgi:ABC-type branched-subunit amino acid transport system permease subunit
LPGASACTFCSATWRFWAGTPADRHPALELAGFKLDTGRRFYYLIWLALLGAVLATRNLLDSREGRAIRALKGGGLMAEAMGVDTAR